MLSMSAMALAESEIPDIKGVWTYKAMAMTHQKSPDANPEGHGSPESGAERLDFNLTIDKQDGFRFSGIEASGKNKEVVVGVIGFDNKTVYWVDEDGMSFCQIVSPDKMEYVYLHTTEHDSVAARGVMTRNPK